MNQDNERLREIRIMLDAYYHELKRSDSIGECLLLQDHIDELETEQKQILERFDVIV